MSYSGTPLGRTASLAIANSVFVTVGVIRMKLVATSLGVAAVGTFGQATLMQSLALILAAAGTVTAGRLEISDGRASNQERLAASARMFRRPVTASAIISLILIAASPLVATLYTGSPDEFLIFAVAACGLTPLALSQSSLALIQVNGTVRELITSSAIYLLTGGVAVSFLVLSESVVLASLSFIASPTLQCVSLAACSPALRTALRNALTDAKPKSYKARNVARASLAISVLSLIIDTAFRSILANIAGIREVAALQPAQLLALQAFSLITVAASQVVMVDQNRNSDTEHETFVRGPWKTAILAANAMALPAIIVATTSLLLIPLFFSADLSFAAPVLLIALAAEPLRALGWIAGSTLLAGGRVRAWTSVQLTGLIVLVIVTLPLIRTLGATAIVIGVLAQVFTAGAATFVILRPRLDIPQWLGLAAITATSCWIALLGLLDLAPVNAAFTVLLPIGAIAMLRLPTRDQDPKELAAH